MIPAVLLSRAILLSLIVAVLAGKWDIWWHVAVGRDTLWEPPHLFLYTGVAVAIGLAFLAWWQSQKSSWRSIALVLLLVPLSAPFDEWWHRVFGVEVLTSPFVIWSPPHLLLIGGLAASVLMLRPILSQDRDPHARRLFGALALAAIFSVLFVLTIPLEPLGAYKVLGFLGAGFTAFLSVLLFFIAEQWIGGVGCVSLVILFFLVFQSVGVRDHIAPGIVIAPHARPPHWIYLFSYLAPALFMDLSPRMPNAVRGIGAGFLYTAVYYGVSRHFIDPEFSYTLEHLVIAVLSGVLGGGLASFAQYLVPTYQGKRNNKQNMSSCRSRP